MKNLKIGMRLAIGFGVVIFFMIAITFIGIFRLAELNNSADTVINTTYPKAAGAHQMSYLAVDTARLARNLILNKDSNAMISNKAALDKNKTQVDAILSNFDKTVLSDKGSDLLKEVRATQTSYFNFTNEVVELALQNNNEDANQVLFGEKYKTQGAYLTALKNLVAYQEEKMQDSGKLAQDMYQSALTLMVGLGVVAVLIGIVAAFLITRNLLRALGGEPTYATEIVQAISSGNLTVNVNVSDSNKGSLLFSMKEMRDSLASIVGQVRQGTDTIATASSQIAAGNMDLSSRTEEQASSLEETAASMEELTSTVKQNADNARQANQLAASASEVAVKGGAVVSQVVDTMASINDSSKKIADIISVIDGIAFQTNILALNAAVEAARAGEQGRGFAVVATEVRNLAQRSASAAKEIKTLIDDSVGKVDTGTRLVTQAGSTMQEIVESVKRVTDVMSEITAASQEQSAGIEQVNQAVAQMDEVTQQNAALVEEAAAAAASLQDQAGNLVQVVSVFKIDGTYAATGASLKASRPAPGAIVASMHRTAVTPRSARTVNPPKRVASAPAAADGEWEQF